MSTISHEPSVPVDERRHWPLQLVRELWASIAIAIVWFAVLVTAVAGADFVSTDAGGNSTTIPSAVPVALFASIATWAIAKYAFGRRRGDE
jgi:hypothetical protein